MNNMNKSTILMIVLALTAAVLIISCKVEPNPTGNQNNEEQTVEQNTQVSLEAKDYSSLSQGGTETWEGLIKISSEQELNEFMDKSAGQQTNYYYGRSSGGFGGLEMAVEQSMADSVGVTSGAKSSQTGSNGGATDVSSTNIQVEGVDEADFVKNDNKHIYIITGDKLAIVEAFPAEDADVVSETDLPGTPQELFINGDKLVVFTQLEEPVYTIVQYDYAPRASYASRMHVLVYDISDRKNPEELHDISVNGNYYDARMIGDIVYFIAQEYVYRYYDNIDMPRIMEGSSVKVMPDVYFVPNPDYDYNFNTVASLDLSSSDAKMQAQTFMLGTSTNLYVSENNIYITNKKAYNYYWWRGNDYNKDAEERFFDVVVPMLKSDVEKKIEAVWDDNSIAEEKKWTEISAILEEMYSTMSEDERDMLIEDIDDAVNEYEVKKAVDREKTVIHRISIDDGSLKYEARGEVTGDLLNQWSMDEYDNHFRVATTTSIWMGDSQQYNNVIVMDMDLDIVGRIEKIAKDERIYSTRFLGDRLYMVTFKRIDPLFVIDLSDHENPKILGELKIPGYSDYLHPYDETHIIGIGKETEGNQWGGVSTAGVKVSLFDVSDVKNPKQVGKLEIGEAGSDSEVLYDHKAFLFNKERDLVVIPVREVKGKQYYDSKWGYYRQRVWQGAYVLEVTPDGITRKAKISHYDGDAEAYGYWYQGPYSVRRSLYMDDVLYTISNSLIMATDMDTFEDISTVDLPYESPYDNYPKPIPMME